MHARLCRRARRPNSEAHPLNACGWGDLRFSDPNATPFMKTGAQMAEWHASLTPRQSSRGAPLRRCKTCMLQSVVHRNEKAIPGSVDMRVSVRDDRRGHTAQLQNWRDTLAAGLQDTVQRQRPGVAVQRAGAAQGKGVQAVTRCQTDAARGAGTQRRDQWQPMAGRSRYKLEARPHGATLRKRCRPRFNRSGGTQQVVLAASISQRGCCWAATS